MGCMGFRRRQNEEVRPEQKWDYISLNDFKSTSCFTPFAYGYLWFSLLLSIAVYGVDTFTAVQLLAFNKWSSSIAPTQLISFTVSKWIFSGCIILSVINLAFEHIRARRIMNRGSVAECYLDNLVVRLESIRLGKGQGWKRFLVFAELTKSKKGAEYVALFTYFSFQSWIRVLLCSGPRQVVNALTLYSVYNANLQINGTDFENSLMNFFAKIKALQTQETLILSGMLFTLVVWVFSFLSLLLAAMFFVFFLWYYIPQADGGLSGYCERKANKRLMKIVSIKINKAMAEDERKRRKAEFKAAKKNGGDRPVSLKATLPNVGGEDKLPEMPMLDRNDTMTTLPQYTSRPGTPGDFELDSLDQKRPFASRTTTQSSSASQFSSSRPLLGAAADMGAGRPESPTPTLPKIDLSNYPSRSGTMASTPGSGFGPGPLNRVPTNGPGFGTGYSASPTTYSSETMPSLPPAVRSPGAAPNGYRGFGPTQPTSRSTMDSYGNARGSSASAASSYRGGPQSPRGMMPNGQGQGPMRSATNPMGAGSENDWSGSTGNRPAMNDYFNGRASPAPSNNSYRGGPQSPRGMGGMGPNGPIRSATNPMPPRGPQPYGQAYAPPQRNMTQPMAPQPQSSASSSSLRNMAAGQPYDRAQGDYDYFNRSGTPSQRSPPHAPYGNNWDQDVERGPGPRY